MYKLQDGRLALNMKEVCQKLGIGSSKCRRLIKQGEITKLYTNNLTNSQGNNTINEDK